MTELTRLCACLIQSKFIRIAAISYLLVGCSSIDQVSTDRQRQELSTAESIIVSNRKELRSNVDQSGEPGALVFTDNQKKTISKILYGSSPQDAWIRYVVATSPEQVSDLPLPSTVSPTAAFIYSKDVIGRSEIISTSSLDREISYRYDLSRTMHTIGEDIQQLRDMTILLSRADKQQKSGVVALKQSFDKTASDFNDLASRLQSLQSSQVSNRAELLGYLSTIETELSNIKALIASM